MAETEVSGEVREIREKLGLTQTAFAERFGVTFRAVQHWEAGTRRPSFAALVLMRQFAAKKGKRKDQ